MRILARTDAAVGSLLPAAAFSQGNLTTADSGVVESPLPGGAAEVVRFLLTGLPPWLQVALLALGATGAVVAMRAAWQHRTRLAAWLRGRSRTLTVAMAIVALGMTAAVATAGIASWNYVQHDNGFCSGCHVMTPAFERFSEADNRHAELSCHACHQQSMAASLRQLALWVAERPERIGPHAPVANAVCETCHVTGDSATWQHVRETAGHRVHLESDSASLREARCVTCHGIEVHRFRPVRETCGQSGCHASSETEIVLGRMAAQTVRHCTSCHPFTAAVPALATTDSARGTLVPGEAQCMGCHEMQSVLRDFIHDADPHGGSCGTCHRPHEQRSPESAVATCATSGCHADWRSVPFHVGPAHRASGSRCTACHEPHRARLDASDCVGCHRTVRARGVLSPPVPFDTAEAVRSFTPPVLPPPAAAAGPRRLLRASAAPTARVIPVAYARQRLPRHGGPSPDDETEDVVGHLGAASLPAVPAAQADTFPHDRHRSRPCLECHETGEGHGRLTFERPRGCALCHHRAPAAERCGSCHRESDRQAMRAVTVTVEVPAQPPRPRQVGFLHDRHRARPCTECHTVPVSLAPPEAVRSCQACHSDHHQAGRDCSSCHQVSDPAAAHRPAGDTHQRCDACHTPTTIAQLVPTRSLCITCHQPKAASHYEPRECSSCHYLATPEESRRHLLSPAVPEPPLGGDRR